MEDLYTKSFKESQEETIIVASKLDDVEPHRHREFEKCLHKSHGFFNRAKKTSC